MSSSNLAIVANSSHANQKEKHQAKSEKQSVVISAIRQKAAQNSVSLKKLHDFRLPSPTDWSVQFGLQQVSVKETTIIHYTP